MIELDETWFYKSSFYCFAVFKMLCSVHYDHKDEGNIHSRESDVFVVAVLLTFPPRPRESNESKRARR